MGVEWGSAPGALDRLEHDSEGCNNDSDDVGITSDTRPHVLFISIDDLNDWVGVLGGHPQARTPNIDRLAARGVTFTNAHCAATECHPSRVALMLGVHPPSTGVYNNFQPFRPVYPDAVTLPQHFRRHGYRSIGAGKIFHDRFLDPDSWDEYYEDLCRQRTQDPVPAAAPFAHYENPGYIDWGPSDLPVEELNDYEITSWVIDHLPGAHDQPTFLGYGLCKPHVPLYVPQRFYDMFPLERVVLPRTRSDDLDDVPSLGVAFADRNGLYDEIVDAGDWRPAVQGYLATIAFVDEMIGRVLDAVDECGYHNRLVIVLWSDHGWHLGEKRHFEKFTLWEEATRVPLIVAGPGIEPGRVCTRPVNLVDIYPTLIDLCRLSPREDLEGHDLRPLLEDPDAEWPWMSLTTYGYGNHAVRSENYRLIRYKDGTEELYDHRSDPDEFDNLVARPDLRRVLTQLRQWLPPDDADPLPDNEAYAEDELTCPGAPIPR